jgi:hypothetical protein
MAKGKLVGLSPRCVELLDAYRAREGGLSYSRAVGRLLGVELPTQGEALKEAWRARRAIAAGRETEMAAAAEQAYAAMQERRQTEQAERERKLEERLGGGWQPKAAGSE